MSSSQQAAPNLLQGREEQMEWMGQEPEVFAVPVWKWSMCMWGQVEKVSFNQMGG